MKRKVKNINLKHILILVVCLIIFNLCFNLIRNTIRKSNIYNVKSYEQVSVDYKGKAYFVFDEYVYNSFEGLSLKTNNDSLIRDDEKISETISINASTKANELKSFLNEIKDDEKLKKNLSKDQIISEIYNEKFSNLDLNYTDSINHKFKFLDSELEFLESYTDKKTIEAEKTGYYINDLDGYETLINKSNIDNFEMDSLNIERDDKDVKLKGLKYLNSKFYNILIEVDNFEKYENINFRNLKVKFDSKEYLVSDYKLVRSKDGRIFMNLYMNEGLTEAKNYRTKDISLTFNELKTFAVPSSSIVMKDGQTGVYSVDSGKVKFAAVKVIYEHEDKSYILTRKEDVYPKAKLDLIEENNANLNYDTSDEDYIETTEIHEFSEVLKNVDNVKIGDEYEY